MTAEVAMNNFDYEKIWQEAWGDMQRYGPVHRHHRRIFSELFKMLPMKGIETIADIGCGEGSNLLFLRSQFPNAKLFGFDVSKTAIETAKSNIDADFHLLDIQKEIPAQRFDLVFCSDVLEHLEDDVTALGNIKAITRQYAMIATIQGRMRANEKTIGHIRNYAYGELQRKMEEVGFRILNIVEWGYPFYSPIFRDLVGFSAASEKFSYGRYSALKKFLTQILYSIFLLNRGDKGDVIFVMAKS